MNEDELRGIYRPLRQARPAGSAAPASLLSGLEPLQPYALFPTPPATE